MPVQLVCKDAECAFAHFFSVLLHGGQFRVGALGDGSVGETADGNLVRHFQSHQLAGIQYTCRRFVINRKEAVGTVVILQQVGRYGNGAFTVVAQLYHAVVHRHFVFLHGIQIAVPPVFGNLQMRRCAVEEDAFASGLNHVLYGGKRAGIVVHNHPFRFQLRTDAVVKHNRYVVVQQLLVVVVLLRVFGKGGYDAANAGGKERVDDFDCLLVGLVALSHDYVVAGFGRRCLDAAQHAREEMMHQLGHNHANRIAAARTEVHGKHIGFVVMFAGVGMDEVTGFPADVRIILERSRHGGRRDIQCPGNIFNGYLRFVHQYDFNFQPKVIKIGRYTKTVAGLLIYPAAKIAECV